MSAEYLFTFDRAIYDLEGYYITRWDKSVPTSVRADTEAAARKAAAHLSGPPPRGRGWVFRLRSVEPAKGDES